MIDTVAPDTSIDAGPDSETEATSATFEFSADEAGAGFECTLDGGAFEPCSSPHTVDGLALGDHTLLVRARDAAGNADPTPAALRVGDRAAARHDGARHGHPRRPAGDDDRDDGERRVHRRRGRRRVRVLARTAARGPAASRRTCSRAWASARTRSTSARSTWPATSTRRRRATAGRSWRRRRRRRRRSTRGRRRRTRAPTRRSSSPPTWPGATFECALDGAAWERCNSPLELLGLSEGPHRLEVRAKHPLGVLDPTPAVREWTVGLPPETVIQSGPASPTVATSATFAFTGTDDRTAVPDIDYECSLDGATFQSCSAPHEVQGLAPGVHQFRVRARDLAGQRRPDAGRAHVDRRDAAGHDDRVRAGAGDRQQRGELHVLLEPRGHDVRVLARPAARARRVRAVPRRP